jgi:subtilisin-like proprotein convertase family protein
MSSKTTIQAVFIVSLINTLQPVYAGTRVTVCNSPLSSIPNNDSTGITDILSINDSGKIEDINVIIDASHNHVGELTFSLVHNDTGTQVTFIDRPGRPGLEYGCFGHDITHLTIDDEGTGSVENNCVPFKPAYDNALSYQPNNALSPFDGENINGNWTLTVSDNHDYNLDEGTLNRWCLDYERVSKTVFNSPLPSDTPISFKDETAIGVPDYYDFEITESSGIDDLIIHSANITGPHLSDFDVVKPEETAFPFTIPINTSSTFKIVCMPSASGERTATLTLKTNVASTPSIEFPLQCVGAAAAASYRASLSADETLDFGEVKVDSSSSRFLRIEEAGKYEDLILSSATITGSHKDDFILKTPSSFPHTISKGTSSIIRLECRPSVGGQRWATLKIRTNDPLNPSVEYKLKCLGLAPSLKSTDDKFDFGASKPPTTLDKTIYIRNTGYANLTIKSPFIRGAGASVFTLTPSFTELTIAVGGTLALTVECHLKHSGLFEATLVLITDDPSQPFLEYPLNCSGSYNTNPLYSSTPVPGSILYFGSRLVGTSAKKNFKIKEMGNDTLKVNLPLRPITGHTEDFKIVSPSFPIIIEDGDPGVNVIVECTPSADGLREATLNLISTDMSDRPTSIHPNPTYTLECNGKAAVYNSTLPPGDTLDFGSPPVGSTVTESFDIQGTGSKAALKVDLAEIALTGPNASDFNIDSSIFPFEIAVGGADKTLNIECTPLGLGVRTAQLNLISNDPLNATPTYNLRCIGQDALGPGYASTPPPLNGLNFGSTPVGVPINQTFDIQEVGNAVLDVGLATPAITGVHNGDFRIISPTFSFYIPDHSADVTVMVQCNPSAAGVRTATLHLTSNDALNPTPTYHLECTGTTPQQPEDDLPLPFNYTLTVMNMGNGTVASLPAGINCGTNCSANYEKDTSLKLMPTPKTGFRFAGFSGDCDASGNVVLDADKSCIVRFNPIKIKPPVEHTGSTSYYEPFSCPLIETINSVCSFYGQTAKDITIGSKGNISKVMLEGTIINDGWISNAMLNVDSQLTGGTLTGTIINYGTLTDIEFRGALLEGGTLSGTIINNGSVGGTIKNVFLSARTKISGGKMAGNIIGDPKAPALLENMTVKAGSYLDNVKIGDNMVLHGDITYGPNVQFVNKPKNSYAQQNVKVIDGKKTLKDITIGAKEKYTDVVLEGTITNFGKVSNATVAHGCDFKGGTLNDDITNQGTITDVKFCGELTGGTLAGEIKSCKNAIISNVKLAENAELSGGILQGDINGYAQSPAQLDSVTIEGKVSNVILGKNVKNEGTITDSEFRGDVLSGGTLSGTIINTFGGTIQDVQLAGNMTLIGGNLKGEIIGDADAPALLEHIRISVPSTLENVIIGDNVYLPEEVILGEGVEFLNEPEEDTPEEVVTAFRINAEGQMTDSRAVFIGEIKTLDGKQPNHAMFSYEEAEFMEISAMFTPFFEEISENSDIFMVAIHKDDPREANLMRKVNDWIDWDEDISSL